MRKVVATGVKSNTGYQVVSQGGQNTVSAVTPKSNTIVVENLAASTSEAQLRKMCQGVGQIEVSHHFFFYKMHDWNAQHECSTWSFLFSTLLFHLLCFVIFLSQVKVLNYA